MLIFLTLYFQELIFWSILLLVLHPTPQDISIVVTYSELPFTSSVLWLLLWWLQTELKSSLGEIIFFLPYLRHLRHTRLCNFDFSPCSDSYITMLRRTEESDLKCWKFQLNAAAGVLEKFCHRFKTEQLFNYLALLVISDQYVFSCKMLHLKLYCCTWFKWRISFSSVLNEVAPWWLADSSTVLVF